MADQVAAHVRIRGRVQGVCFRWETKQAADRHAVKGWVRNRSDGSVEALFEGDRSAVEAVLSWCRQGPEISQVDDVAVRWEDGTQGYDGFDITR
jgi:acylphosphatase